MGHPVIKFKNNNLHVRTHPLFVTVLRLGVERDGLDEVGEVPGGLDEYPASSLLRPVLSIGVTILIIDRAMQCLVNQPLPSLSGWCSGYRILYFYFLTSNLLPPLPSRYKYDIS